MLKKFLALFIWSMAFVSACYVIPFGSDLTPTEHLSKGLALYDKKNYKKAKKHLEKAVEHLQDLELKPKAIYLYAESLYHLKDYPQASQQFSRLALSFPDDSLADVARNKIESCYRQQFYHALKKYHDEDYLDARNELKVIILSSRMSSIIDSARYYYADCFYHTKEYILAIGEFERLIKFYPRSPLVDDAQYKVAMSYYKLSPKYSLDQEYTEKAIQEFQRFLEEYPGSNRRQEAEKYFLECRTKLCRKDYETGKLYRKMGEFEAAIISYQKVIDEFYDTKYAPMALYWKAECLRKIGKLNEARDDFDKFLKKYPKHNLFSKAESGLKKLISDTEEN